MKKKVIELGKIAVTGLVVGYMLKTISYIAVEAAKAKAATPADAVTVTKREIDWEEIPAEIREKLQQQ